MIKKTLNRRIIGSILQEKTVRITILLNLILIIICIVLFSLGFSFDNKTSENNKQIQDIQLQIKALQASINEPQAEPVDQVSLTQTLAPYGEIVPYISFLESLFAIIDKDSKITIKDEEKQIMINRYADYEVSLKPGEKMDLFLKALDGLYKSKYLTKITSFKINYIPTENEIISTINDINLVIRLYFE